MFKLIIADFVGREICCPARPKVVHLLCSRCLCLCLCLCLCFMFYVLCFMLMFFFKI